MRLSLAIAACAVVAGCADEPDRPRPPRTVRVPETESGPPRAREVTVYFLRDAECEVYPVSRTVTGTRTPDFAWGALEELVRGPTPGEREAGFRSAIPDTLQVQRHWQSHVAFDRDPPHDGEHVKILETYEIEGGLLYVNFSRELNAYGRGADRVCAIVRQIQETVAQFPEYEGVRIAIDGETKGILQP